jgi:hypothetical protein
LRPSRAWQGSVDARNSDPDPGLRDLFRAAVSPGAVDAALRHLHLHLDLVRNGAPAETLGRWIWSAHWFPHLKWDAEIVALLDGLPAVWPLRRAVKGRRRPYPLGACLIRKTDAEHWSRTGKEKPPLTRGF